MCAYVDSGDSNKGKNKVCSISGTAITPGTGVTFDTGSVAINGGNLPQGVVAIDSSTSLIAYRSSNTTYGVVSTISGTTVTNATRVQIDTDSGVYHSPCLLDADRIFLAYQTTEGATSDGTGIVLKK